MECCSTKSLFLVVFVVLSSLVGLLIILWNGPNLESYYAYIGSQGNSKANKQVSRINVVVKNFCLWCSLFTWKHDLHDYTTTTLVVLWIKKNLKQVMLVSNRPKRCKKTYPWWDLYPRQRFTRAYNCLTK